jgi:hypothetical protein
MIEVCPTVTESADESESEAVVDAVISAPQAPDVDPIGSRLAHGLLRFPLGGGTLAAPRW